MSRSPAWVVRCITCKAQFGPLHGQEQVQQLLAGSRPLDCGHVGCEVVSESF